MTKAEMVAKVEKLWNACQSLVPTIERRMKEFEDLMNDVKVIAAQLNVFIPTLIDWEEPENEGDEWKSVQ